MVSALSDTFFVSSFNPAAVLGILTLGGYYRERAAQGLSLSAHCRFRMFYLRRYREAPSIFIHGDAVRTLG